MKKLTYFAVSALATNFLVGCGDNTEPVDDQEEPIEFPRTCAEVAVGHPLYGEGERTLYFNGDATKPWQAYCVDLKKDAKEYLTVRSTWSVYSDGSGDQVRTEYDKVRIDPLTLKLDTSDQTFAVSTGTLMLAGVEVSSMPVGVALSCGFNPATAQINLEDTPFVIEDHFVKRGDNNVAGSASPWASNRTIEIWNEGDCSWTSPDLMSGAPINAAGGYLISLQYSK